MEVKKQRKTDRRTVYTRTVIKDALLSLLSVKDYMEITVTDICREAEISRGTFYLHYDNIAQVIDAIFDDAFASTVSVLEQVGIESEEDKKCAYPLCTFLRENKKYQALFLSDSLFSQVAERVTKNCIDNYFHRLKISTELSDEEAFSLRYFQFSGCISVCKRNIDKSDEEWGRVQCAVDRFIKGGLENL